MNMICVERKALYQGHIPITQNGRKCAICGTEYWPDYPGCNRYYGPEKGYCCRTPSPKKEEKAEIKVLTPSPVKGWEDLDF